MNILQQSTQELFALMRSVITRIDATQKGEASAPFDNAELTTLLLCVGDAMLANHRAMRGI